ncbi:hypothetical protein D3C73_1407050 [compost metagenome]
MVSRIIASESITQPSSRYRPRMMISTSIGARPLPITQAASSPGICVSARPELSRSAPSRTRKIIAVVSAVPSMLARKPLQRMPPWHTASTPQAAAPMEAASVGLAQPP